MNHSRNAFIILFILGLVAVFSAGCISLGTTTSDIQVGNQTVGTISITPTSDLLGNKSFINNLSYADKTELLRLLTGNDSIDLSTFMETGEKKNEDPDFWSQLMNMKLTSKSDKTLSESINTPDLGEELNNAMDALNKFLDDIKF